MSSYSEVQTHQLMDALQTAGFTADEVTKLGQFKKLLQIRDIVNNLAVISYPQHLIDCDALPFCPDGWEVVEHRKHGQLQWDPSKIRLHLSKKQTDGKVIGNKLRKELENQSVLNANVLDYLLAHPDLIPEEWKGKAVFFWGTIYRYSDGYLCVRCLCWSGDRWGRDCGWLDRDFCGRNPAAVSASI